MIEVSKLTIRRGSDVKEWLQVQRRQNASSIGSEIDLAVREKNQTLRQWRQAEFDLDKDEIVSGATQWQ